MVLFTYCEFPHSFHRRKLKPCKLLIADFLQRFIIIESFIFPCERVASQRAENANSRPAPAARGVSTGSGSRDCMIQEVFDVDRMSPEISQQLFAG